MTEFTNQNLQRNKLTAQATEKVLTQIVRLGADAFRALIKFIKEMFDQVIGK
ncbi:MAG: hypothetical protein ABII10_01050 [Candidatus Paceibacterota bacterium]